ncbi:MAG: chromosome segregation protein SMC [Acidobacteria bacterium]|nr:chromosome segregation protein SMC [Acidobacteriota bacterium]MCW5948185.1 chromosome segregation protein SMC [Pyrinomonadaceae bacterium]
MFRLQRLEISGFKSFADHTEIVFTGNGITAVVGPNGCGKSNVSDAISWVLGEQRARSLRGGEMKDVVFAGTKSRKPGGMAEVVLHLIRDDSLGITDETDLDEIDETLAEIDETAVDMEAIEGVDDVDDLEAEAEIAAAGEAAASESEEVETVKALAVGSAQVVETRARPKRHWRPRSFALDFAPGEAVSVTRRLYLSGESEYLLNGKTCRLRDISDLFAGTGLSGSHYAIIEQGRIGQILSSKPADRRGLIEEAAGISKFRTRQRAAESRLESARANLHRITDIVSEIETRVNSLRRQAAKTRRFKMLQEEFRALLRQYYSAEGRHLSSLLEETAAALADAGELEQKLQSDLAAKEEAARETTRAARDAEESLAELRRIHSANALERDRAEREHVYRSEQVVALNERCESLRSEIDGSRTRIELLSGEIDRLRKDDDALAAAFAAADGEFRDAEAAHTRAFEALNLIETRIETLRAELIQHTAAAERFDEIGRQLEHNLDRLTTREQGLGSEGERAERTYQANREQAESLAAQLADEESKLRSLSDEKEDLSAATAAARQQLREREAELDALTEELSARSHRLATLNELEETRAVYAPQVQKLFSAADEIGVRMGGVLADRLRVDERAEKAVEALFGDHLEAVIVDSLGDARRVSDWLDSKGVGRASMFILSHSSSRNSSPDPGSIAAFMGADDDLAAALDEVFPREMRARLVDDVAEANAVPGEILIDTEGRMLTGGRLFIGGGTRRTSGTNESLLAFKRELNGLGSVVAELDRKVTSARADVEAARAALVDLESKTVDLQSLIIKVDRGIHGLQIQIHAAREEIDRADRHRRVVADESRQISEEIEETRSRLADALADRESADSARKESSALLGSVSDELARARASLDEANVELNEKRMAAVTADERRRSAQTALRRVENEHRDAMSRLALQEMEMHEASEKIRELHNTIDQITDRINTAPDEVAAENKVVDDALSALAAARELADRTSSELAEMNHAAADALNHRAEIEVRQAEAATLLRNITENCHQELNLALDELISTTEIPEGFDLAGARLAADDLRSRLDNFGAINMLALEELGEAEERHLFLTSQREDIVAGIAATEEALREIKQRSRDKFRQAFEAINENFKEFFVELFGGGTGEMTLLEADDILEAGIEVIAQPPGKRLQNILLLSGGEKAMTAIALVMAIFKYRPSPFCLLDEVDAPLDDANVGRFVDKIAGMAEKTQFIVITHNKRTMEAARALYGVTMQEPGVSKVVSVKFE